MSAKVFITHSHHDIEFARRLSNDLAARAVEVWFDDTSLRGGERLAEEINRGLAWCDVYIPVITRAALASTWCWEEMNAAIALSNRPSRAGRLRIIPVLAEDRLDELPPSLLSRLSFNLAGRYTEGLQELLQKGFGIAATAPVAKAAPVARLVPRVDPKIQQLQAVLQRLTTTLRGLEECGHRLPAAMTELARLSAGWRGHVSDQELLRRLESLQRINDLAIAALPHVHALCGFLVYANPQIGIGPGNLGEAAGKYRQLVAEGAAGTPWADHLLRAVQQAAFLPQESAQALIRVVNQIRGHVNYLNTETAKLGQI